MSNIVVSKKVVPVSKNKKKNKKKIWIILGVIIGVVVIAVSVTVPLIILNSSSEKKQEENSLEYKNYSFDEVMTANPTSIGVFDRKVLSSNKRSVQNKFYETDLLRMYQNEYNFRYPGYDYNYEKNSNNIFSNSNGQTIDGMELVFNERTPNGLKYNDSNFILDEINNNSLKKHPAATHFYENSMDNIPSETTKFEISTASIGTYTLGLFAPAGEVVTLTFDDETFEKISKLNWNKVIISINDNYWDNYAAPDSGKISNRYPFIKSDFRINPSNKSISFGTPFGGNISLRIEEKLYKNNTELPIDNEIDKISFTVSGAIPTMFYQDGITTREDWENQKKLAEKQMIAPVVQGNGSLLSFNIPFTNLNEVSGLKVKDFIYPAITFRKWNEYIYLSNYFAGRDIEGSLLRENLKFCDDIWGGAAAWGGGMNAYCPIAWGVRAFLNPHPDEMFTSSSLWGLFHEINHSFQQDAAIFKRRDHGETNQASIFNLSVISDTGRTRSELNFTGERGVNQNSMGWQRLNNPYSNFYSILRSEELNPNADTKVDEYAIYSILLSTFGSKKYSDYVRYDVRNSPNNNDSWTGFKEIEELSNFFKVNLWPAFYDYGRLWCDNWPKSSSEITQEQQLVINDLQSKYKAIDFIANHYAVGSYTYDSDISGYVYNGDIVSPWETQAGLPMIINLDKFIVSTNKKFNWIDVEFNSTTKYGGKLELYPGNKKKLIYTPPKDISNIDEFDITIIPGDWDGKPSNYVPGYKFKIKIRQVINEPILIKYEDFSDTVSFNSSFGAMHNMQQPIVATQPIAFTNTNMYDSTSKKQGVKIAFKFVAPEDGTYSLYNKWDDWIRCYINKEKVFESSSYSLNFKQMYELELKKGQVINIELYGVNTGGSGVLDLYINKNGKEFNWLDYTLVPYYEKIVNKNALEIVNDESYKYKPRTIDKNIFKLNTTTSINLSNYSFDHHDPKKYKLTSKYKNVDRLNDIGESYFELWNEDHAKGQAASSFEVNFNEPTKVSSLFFGHRTNNHWESRATNIKVTGYSSSQDTNGIILYDGEYGNQFNDRKSAMSILNLNTSMNVIKLKIEAYNTKNNGLIWSWFRCSGDKYRKIKSLIGCNNNDFYYSGNWLFRKNDEDNQSNMNNLYAKSTRAGDYFEITLDGSSGFNLIGQLNNIGTKINIYVNNQKINSNPILLKSDNRIDNACLYSYLIDNNEKIKIKIEHLDDNPLYFNFLMNM